MTEEPPLTAERDVEARGESHIIGATKGTAMALDPISLSTTPVILAAGNQNLFSGTGFLFMPVLENTQLLFLVTNYHVLTGSAPLAGIAPAGDRIHFHLHKSQDDPSDILQVEYPLFTRDGLPVWLTSTSSPEADIALIPLASEITQTCANLQCISQDWIDINVFLRPASPVSIVGYPYALYDTYNGLPIWKTGSLATEPDRDFQGKPVMLVDISAFQGMSGSPVFAIRQGAYELDESMFTFGPARRLLGVMSAIQTRNHNYYVKELVQAAAPGVVVEENLQLAYVWKARILSEIVAHFDVDVYQSRIASRLADLRSRDS